MGGEGLEGAHLGELVGDLREVGVAGWLLLEGHHHKVFKELPFLPLKQLQLQCPVAGCTLQHGLDVDQALRVSCGQGGSHIMMGASRLTSHRPPVSPLFP